MISLFGWSLIEYDKKFVEIPCQLPAHPKLAVWEWEVESDAVRWSPQLRVMLGYEETELEPTWAEHRRLLTPDGFERLEAAVQHCLQTGEEYCVRVAFEGAGRKQTLLEIYGSVAEWRDGRPIRLNGVCFDRTSERIALRRLRRTTRLLSRTARIGRIGGWRLDLSTRQMTWSAEMYRIHGVRRDFEPSLEGMVQFYQRESCAKLEAAIDGAEARGDSFELDLDLHVPNGSRRRLRVIATCEWENGRSIVSGTTQDISSHYELQTERDLLFSVSQDLLGIADFEGHYRQVNPAWMGLLGWSESEMKGSRWIDLVHPDDVEETLDVSRSLADGQTLATFSNRLRCRDGSYRSISWKAVPVIAEGCIIFVARDTTEQVAAERELEERRRTIDAILEHTLAGYWDWDITRDEETVSETFRRMFGYGDAVRREWPESWRRLILPEDLPLAREAFRAHLASRGDAQFSAELRCRHRDGSVVWILVAGSVVEWLEDGSPARMVGCHLDITKSKWQESERHRAEQALSEAALDERRRLAFHMHDGVGQLLTALAMTAKRLAGAKDSSESVREDAVAIQHIVRDTHRRIRAITRGLVPEEVTRENFVKAVERLAEACAAGFQIRCVYEGPAEVRLPHCFGALQIYLIIQEAILNAVRHGEASEVVVRLEQLATEIDLTVDDNGSGFEIDDEGSASHGLGLRSMATRAREAGGELNVSRSERGGTRVGCRVKRYDAISEPTIL